MPEITTCEKIEKVEHAKCHIEQQREIFGDSFMLNEGDAIRVADVDKAKEIMRSLNPGVKDDEQLMALLMDHIKGKPLNIHPDMLKSAQDSGGQVKQTLFPVGEPLAGADRNGYRATHEFRTQLTDGSAKVFTVVEMIVSPSVLAVADLMTETECLNLERLASEGNLYKESIASLMKVRMDQQLLTYIIPNVRQHCLHAKQQINQPVHTHTHTYICIYTYVHASIQIYLCMLVIFCTLRIWEMLILLVI